MRWGNVLLFSILVQFIFLNTVSALEFRQLTDSPSIDRHPSWTPDSQYIVFESNRNGTFDLYRVPATGGAAVQLTSGPQDERFPEVSPDGNQIAFSWFSPLNGQMVGNIYVVSISGGSEWTQISTSDHFMDFDWHPAWSRDGSTIYFSRRKGTDFLDYAIMRVPAGGGASTVFYDAPGGQNRPIPSWDGTKLAFESDEAGSNLNIYETILAQPGSKRQLTFENVNTGAMGYSPDGQTMVFSSRRVTGWFDLYLLNLQDLTFTQLTNDAATSAYDPNNSDAVYSPDGTKIAFTSRRNIGNDNIWVIDLNPVLVQEIGVDVLPSRCPNQLPDRFRGTLKVAIPGSAEFDPSLIDPTSIRLQGSNVPDRWSVVNVTAPASGPCECPGKHDAYDDLLLEFDHWNPPSSAMFDGKEEELMLEITGNLADGTPIHGSDCLTLSGPPSGRAPHGAAILSVDRVPGGSSVTYSVGEPGRVEIAAFDVSGRRLITLVNQEQPAGQFQAHWDAPKLASGIYFYKLVAGGHEDVRKFVVRR